MRTKRKLVTTLMIAAGLFGWRAVTGLSQLVTLQQCYRNRDLDPLDACSICMLRCLGDGYKCCVIFSG
jgi:hypothetical protein